MKLRTPENQNGEQVPVGRLMTAQGLRVAFAETASSHTEALDDGVYIVSVSAPAFVSIGANASAGELAGSFPIGAGGAGFFRIRTGDRVAARGVDGAGSLFVIPLETA
jgi:hypothetical protein